MISRSMLPGFSVAVLSLSTTVSAIAADRPNVAKFNSAIDTRLSMEFQKTIPAARSRDRQLVVYKILDVQETAQGDVLTPMPGDILELSIASTATALAAPPGDTLPWAEVKSDGMILMHIPREYIRPRAATSTETIWRIENPDNWFAFIQGSQKK
ncbi:MAG: hypothetical protein K2Z81_21035 [Cyanobacteria bacterium]|nr:hypothetical protein [Cyanobacteriota bacterium]